MSEEFDKEAEREKLREKLEKDEQKRQQTQRMSELLLQGATMTNEHCDACGDPLFRDGGETFCPTCAGADTEASGQTAEQTQQRPQSGTPSQGSERTNGTEPTPQVESADADGSEQESAGGRVDEQPIQAPSTAGTTEGTTPRAELQRAVTTAARKANQASDPRTAKEWLEASKEAAEALAALER